MTDGAILIAVMLGVPLAGAALTVASGHLKDVRDTLSVVTAIGLTVACAIMFVRTGDGAPSEWRLAEPLPGLALAFRAEPLGALFAMMASALWAVNTVFSIGYMRGGKEVRQTRFYTCFGLAMVGAMGVAMAANLFTLFIFYEVLTLATYPLVAHKGDKAAQAGARFYLVTLVGASAGLLLPGIVGVLVIAGTTEFQLGGVLAGKADDVAASVFLLLIVFGTAKAALIPLHGWLPRAMVAPTPVSALLHAVAVVKAGVFTLLKVSVYTFGPGQMATTPAAEWLTWLAAATIVIASLVALRQDELKARLAWSTVGQLAYITAGAMMAGASGAVAGGAHMLTHAVGKITLFMCAGSIYVATGCKYVSELAGIGRVLPVTTVAFLVASLSVIGVPPLAGAWSKFLLLETSFRAGEAAVALALVISSLLSAAYLVPIAVRGFAPGGRSPTLHPDRKRIASVRLMEVALAMAATGAVLLFFLGDAVVRYLAPISGAAP
jgi:multicomponent Na+:H+ antiporter subunit D